MNLRRSEEITERLRSVLPGGDTRTSTFFAPFPIVMERGEGYRLWDVDGNSYVDLLNNFTSLVHGHAHPKIVAAVRNQARSGLSFSAPHVSQAELAERIVDRVDSVEQVRFTNSGTEAVLQAVRAARTITGRDHIVKAHGGYHGSWEQVPMTSDNMLGTPQAVKDLIEWVDLNDVGQLEETMTRCGDEVAAVLLEPVMGAGGVIETSSEYAAAARRLADRHGALLICDEVIALRLARAGYQSVLGVRPDLTTMGKIIGGGLPVGALGGSTEVMAVFDPRSPSHIDHGGTFNGNPMTMAAGCVSLDLLTTEEIDRINALGADLAARLRDRLAEAQVPGTVTSVGSLLHVHLGSSDQVHTYRGLNDDLDLQDRFHAACLSDGIYFARRGLMNVSTVMDEGVVASISVAVGRALERIGGEGPDRLD